MKQASFWTAIPKQTVGSETLGWSLKNFLTQGARDWKISPRLMIFIGLIIPAAVMLFGAATALMGKEAYKWFTGEDGASENLQVLFWGLALILGLIAMLRLWKAGAKVFALLYLLLDFGMIFIIGEEISWGQRIFGWETSESMKAINKQEETNIHNIEGIGDKIKWLHVLMGAYGTILPLVFLRAQMSARPLDAVSLLVPHYTLLPYFFTTLVWRLQANLWKPPKRFYFVITEYSEVMELVLAIAFFLFLFFQFRNLKVSKKPVVVEEPVLNSMQRMNRLQSQRVR
jgi:hypothetical protein